MAQRLAERRGRLGVGVARRLVAARRPRYPTASTGAPPGRSGGPAGRTTSSRRSAWRRSSARPAASCRARRRGVSRLPYATSWVRACLNVPWLSRASPLVHESSWRSSGGGAPAPRAPPRPRPGGPRGTRAPKTAPVCRSRRGSSGRRSSRAMRTPARRRHGLAGPGGALARGPRQLLEEEGVALGPARMAAERSGGHVSGRDRAQDGHGVVLRQRPQRDLAWRRTGPSTTGGGRAARCRGA